MTAPRTAAGRALHADLRRGVTFVRSWDAEGKDYPDYAIDRILAIEAEADRSLLLDAALRRLVACKTVSDDDLCGWCGEYSLEPELEDALAATRAALAATDVRGALAEALRDTMHRTGWSIAVSEGTSMEVVADAILTALAAKGVEG